MISISSAYVLATPRGACKGQVKKIYIYSFSCGAFFEWKQTEAF